MARSAIRPFRLVIVLAALLAFGVGCRFAKQDPNVDPVAEAREAYDASVDAAPAGEVADLALDYAGQSDVPAFERVRALGGALRMATESQSVAEIERLLGPLDTALRDMAKASPDPAWGVYEMEAEAAVRASHRIGLTSWSGGDKAAAERLLDQAFDVYQAHFAIYPEAPQVLWDRAEYLRRARKQDEAIAAYERVIAEDPGGSFGRQAQDSIIAIWTVASTSEPLPKEIEGRQEIPSPHKEWMAIAQQRIDEAPTAPDSRQHMLRFAELQFAYGQIGDGNSTLRRVITEAEDGYSVDAASELLQRLADSKPSKKEFRTVRKELQANKFLWADKDFRLLVKKLRTQVEGK